MTTSPDSPPLTIKRLSRRSRPPLRTFWLPWQSKQCVRRIGRMSFSKVSPACGGDSAAWLGDPQITPITRPTRTHPSLCMSALLRPRRERTRSTECEVCSGVQVGRGHDSARGNFAAHEKLSSICHAVCSTPNFARRTPHTKRGGLTGSESLGTLGHVLISLHFI